MVDNTDNLKLDVLVGQPKIKVVGVGGGGSNAVSRMYRERIPEVEYISINTDSQALARSQTPIRLRVGDTTARGLGVGGDPVLGQKCHEENRAEIRETLKGADLVFIAAGMGGGTGTGGAPIVAEVSKEIGALTIGVVTKPFSFEGAKRITEAVKGVRSLAEKVDTIIIIPNDRLVQIADAGLSMSQAFAMADDVLRQGIQAIAELILTPGDINLDFADVKSVMANAGQAWMAVGQGSGENRALKAAQKAVESPLLEVDIDGARGMLFNVTGGPDLTLDEVHATAEFMQQIVSEDAHIFFGTTSDPKLEDEVHITVIATGFPLSDTHGEIMNMDQTNARELLENESQLNIPPRLRGKFNRHQFTPQSASAPQTPAETTENATPAPDENQEPTDNA